MPLERGSNLDDAANGGSVRKASPTEEIRASLRDMGAPEISEEDFARLYKGRMLEVLDIVSCNVVGRNRVASARTAIQQFRELSNARRLHVEHDTDPMSTSARRADSHLKNARASLTAIQTSREEQVQSLSSLEREEMELQKILEDKRRTALLLSVLEHKEKIRNNRFVDIAMLLEELRRKTNRTKTRSLNDSPPRELRTQTKAQRAEHTRDTLSALQSYALRVSRLSQRTQETSSPSRVKKAEERLLQAVTASLSSTTEDEKVVSTFQTLCAAGKSQARPSVVYRSALPPETEKAEDLQELTLRVHEKEDELQGLFDHSAALTVTCAQSLQTITNFANETSPALRDGLREESNSAQGHVDLLRLSVINRRETPTVPNTIDGLSRGQSFDAVLETIQRQATESQDTEQFLREIETLIAPGPASRGGYESLIEHYVKEESELSERVKKLLERKAEKSEVGQLLIQDIERLVAEVGIISGAHV
ncbi:hypothetical protein LXA43DRAFT_988074 [Ganoderma leucocontextum]|nr:hypothetical protein LXA43DRAFT_988074 [Ganoderma leucocontextum]